MRDDEDLAEVRLVCLLCEAVHAVVYYAPEPLEAYAALGLRGYWRGYFASRAAALGEVSAELVTALFAGFAPAFVARAIPSVWTITTPEQALAARQDGAAAALRRLFGPGDTDTVAKAGALLARCVDAMPLPGRPMAAALRAHPRPDDQVAALWRDCTVVREFRGDGHLGAVAEAGLVWPEPHVLRGDRDPMLREHRGWDEGTWEDATARMRARGPDPVREELELGTDRLAAPLFHPLDDGERRELRRLLGPLAMKAATTIPFPNAMGLPAPG